MEISRELLERLYNHEGLKQREIAEKLNVNLYEVQNSLAKYKINKAKKPPKRHYLHWTNEEIEYLRENYGVESWSALAKYLNRTLSSIKNKIRKLDLGDARKATEYINASELAEALGRSKSTVVRWLQAKKLEAPLRTITEKDKLYRIKIEKFWKFAKENPKYMKWDLYTRNSLGEEPLWLDAVIKEYYKNQAKNGTKDWSKTELSYLEYYYSQGLTAKEIGKRLGRTKSSIEARISILGLANKKISIPWKPIEIKMLLDMKEKNMTLGKIANELGRSLGSVTVKWNRLKLDA